MNAIEIEGLHVHRGAVVLDGIDLQVAEGESVALVGADQTSLTALVRCCGGLDRPDRGRVRVAGTDVLAADRYALLDLQLAVGYVSTHGGLLANMTLRDNVELPLRYRGSDSPEAIRERSTQLLSDAGLLGRADARASTVSAEVEKCVAYLRAVAPAPRMLLVEDPSALLPPGGRALVRGIHQRLRAAGATVLMTDDDLDFAAELVDRVITVDGGRIVATAKGGAA
ncbi:MAG: ATP-binding cassette domain-containing protein [Deltaproteobacteria bacterium]|nr:ATP-binding cassette domain-containing protein [Deltaproteobacteria bacterium]